jgi:predicted ABC-class ATPase
MPGSIELATCLERMDGRGYKAYRDTLGVWAFSHFDLHIDHVQSDPFASPSKMRVRVPLANARFPDEILSNRTREIASASFLARRFRDAIRVVGPRRVGTGKSGVITIDAGGQEVLERTAVVFGDGFVEARIEIGLPAAGRRILADAAADLLVGALPQIVNRAWLDRNEETDATFVSFIDCIENQEFVRARLTSRNLVAFVGDGARLPRESGASERPLPRRSTLPFESPETFRIEFEVPHANAGAPGSVWRGMGIPRGVVLLVGGGYHGKSTLLRAVERGIVPHVPGDGRETVVSDPALVKIRAEDGRAVTGVDIHGFIDHLPRVPGSEKQLDTHVFSTTDASGSTSQAANIIEALEVGARGLLLDEDSSATNFMVRDARMQALVSPGDEPITPFLERVRELYDEFDVSTLLVMGASGEFFAVADAVIELKDYQPRDVTERARSLAEEGERSAGTTRPRLVTPLSRVPDPDSFDARRGRREVKLSSRGCEEIVFGTTEIDLRSIDQLFDSSQTRAIASAIRIAATRFMRPNRSLSRVLDDLEALLDAEGLDVLDPFGLSGLAVPHHEGQREGRGEGRHPGAFARPRRFEVAAAINRMRSLRVSSLDRE